jgi:hypothetical protein
VKVKPHVTYTYTAYELHILDVLLQTFVSSNFVFTFPNSFRLASSTKHPKGIHHALPPMECFVNGIGKSLQLESIKLKDGNAKVGVRSWQTTSLVQA